MKIDFEILQLSVDEYFQEFIARILRLTTEPLKYYYWTQEFFEVNGDLIFKHFEIPLRQKKVINEIGNNYFNIKSVNISIEESSIHNELSINNYSKLFEKGKKLGQNNRLDYIKEFVLWRVLTENNFKIGLPSISIELQKRNFLFSYLRYLFTYTSRPSFPEFKDYIRYNLTNQGEVLVKKLDELDSKGVDNSQLRTKLSRLFVHRDEESKIHFVFSREGGEEKEELRELLDVMGRDDTGNLYRGQANALWGLNSSLTRERKFLDNEAEMYYDILSLKPDAFDNNTSVYERLITMQHFGMPTRLMDITRNPLVAIFFACNNKEREKSDGIVFIFSPAQKDFLNFEDSRLDNLKKLFNCSKEEIENDDFLSDIWYVKGVAKNQRINNQSGDFIFVGEGAEIKERLKKLSSLSVIIDSPTKKVLLEQLESLNIHGGAVYPDLTNMSTYIKNKYSNDKSTIIAAPIKTKPKARRKAKKKKVTVLPDEKTKQVYKPLVDSFDPETFWSKTRLKMLKEFSKANKLEQEKSKEILEKIISFGKSPIRSDVATIMDDKPKLMEYDMVVNPLIEYFSELAKAIVESK